MRTIMKMILLIFLCSCRDSEVLLGADELIDNNEKNNSNCLLVSFNRAFMNIEFSQEKDIYQFDSVFTIVPNFKPNFYNNNISNEFYFFSLVNPDTKFRVAIKKIGNTYSHEVYFLSNADGNEYLEEGENILGDFTFLNDCGFNIYSDSITPNSFNWTSNFYDKRLMQKWYSIDSHSDSLIIKFDKDFVEINSQLIKYKKDGNKILNNENKLLLNIIALGDGKTLIYYNDEIIELMSY